MEIKNFKQFMYEGSKGIHPAVRKHLLDFFKKNKKGTFKEAQKYIKSKIKSWDLSKDDYTEAKSINEAILFREEEMTLPEKLEKAYEQLGEILDNMEGKEMMGEYETKAHKLCNDIQILYSNMVTTQEKKEEEPDVFEMPVYAQENPPMIEDEDEDEYEAGPWDDQYMGEY